ncbi:MAG: hypothetical protein ACOYN0_05240 [Phycisphaerales bacterium]
MSTALQGRSQPGAAMRESQASWGPYQLLRQAGEVVLGPLWKAQRHYAMHGTKSSSHMVYVLGHRHDRGLRRRVEEHGPGMEAISDPHLLRYEVLGRCEKRGCCVACPYTGDQTGLLTLRRLRELKGGALPSIEVRRAVEHLLLGLKALHGVGLSDGLLDLDRALVDRRGAVVIELPGLPLLYRSPGDNQDDLRRADLLAVGRMAYELLYGREPDPRGVARVSSSPESAWDLWLASALDPWEGFATAADAVSLLPAEPVVVQSKSVVQQLIDWIKG